MQMITIHISIRYDNFKCLWRYSLKFSIVQIFIKKMIRAVFEEAAKFRPEKLAELEKKSDMQIWNL